MQAFLQSQRRNRSNSHSYGSAANKRPVHIENDRSQGMTRNQSGGLPSFLCYCQSQANIVFTLEQSRNRPRSDASSLALSVTWLESFEKGVIFTSRSFFF